jgi:ADP-heptose:LPS heptosyltransferase
MKGSAFVFIILVSALLLAGWPAPIAFNSDESGTLLKIKSLQNRIDPPPRQLLADRTDTKDEIIYGTDPEMERAMAKQAKEEKEKEEKAWIMLQNMNLRINSGKNPRSTQQGSSQPGSTQPDNAPSK